MKKLVLISTYFGSFPSYFNIWLKSAEANKDITFLFYTDCNTCEYSIPENVKIIKTTFEELREQFQNKFDFKINLNSPYKFCDYKPAYAYVFENDIKDFDYWGHFDIDTVLGDIQKFLPDNDNYEKIYQYGHLCIYKNTFENNRRFMLDGGQNYKDVFTTPTITVFDEVVGMDNKFKILNIPTYRVADCADITKRLHRFTLTNLNYNKENQKTLNHKHQVFYYQNNKVYRSYYKNGEIYTDEYNYIHFSSRKMPDHTNGYKNFYITNKGFFPKNEDVTLDIINKYNPVSPFADKLTYYKWRKKDAIRKIKKILKGK